MFEELVLRNRSYRRFYEEKTISAELLKKMVGLGHMTPSGANKQPVRFVLVNSKDGCRNVYETLRWAGYYKDWDGPDEGERPSAYVIMLSPQAVNCQHDEGIIGQTILLAAVELGLGGCFIGNIDREMLATKINVPDEYVISLVIALGYPKENVVIENINSSDDIKYYRDAEGTHHVPKIKLKDVIVDEL